MGNNLNFVAIDFETATAKRNSICQIGITDVIDGKPQSPRTWLVMPPGNEYYDVNIMIHGIHPEDTKNSPLFPQVWEEVSPLLNGKIVVSHNVSFDMYALRDTLDSYQIPYPDFIFYCTLRLAKYIIKGPALPYSFSLDILLDFLNIPFSNHHDAGADSLGCAQLLLYLLNSENATLEELEDKYHFMHGKFSSGSFSSQHSTKNY
ncbi:MAG: 3'-5' exonuclease [Prevotella sp.]|jgi:DNA polymerase-3 subunit epsilon